MYSYGGISTDESLYLKTFEVRNQSITPEANGSYPNDDSLDRQLNERSIARPGSIRRAPAVWVSTFLIRPIWP